MTLNYIRSVVGVELGLDCNPVNLADEHIDIHDARYPVSATDPRRTSSIWVRIHYAKDTEADQFIAAFNQFYIPLNLLTLLKVKLNNRIGRDEDFRTMLIDFFRNSVLSHQADGHATPAQVDALPAPYLKCIKDDGEIYDPIMDFNYRKYDAERVLTWDLTEDGVKFVLVELNFLEGAKNCHIAPVQAEEAAEVELEVQ